MRAARSLWSDRKSQEKVIDRGEQERERREEEEERERERERESWEREIEGDEERQTAAKEKESVLECAQGIQVPYRYGITTRAFVPGGWVALAVAEIKLDRV